MFGCVLGSGCVFRVRLCKNPSYKRHAQPSQLSRIKRLNKLALKTIGATVDEDDDDEDEEEEDDDDDNEEPRGEPDRPWTTPPSRAAPATAKKASGKGCGRGRWKRRGHWRKVGKALPRKPRAGRHAGRQADAVSQGG